MSGMRNMMLRNQRPSPANAQGPGGGGGGTGGQPGNVMQGMQRLLGGRDWRYNRALDKFNAGEMILKIPDDFSADEYNTAFGMGTLAVGAGVAVALNVGAPRDLILRELLLDEQTLAFGAAGTQDARLTVVTIEGNTAIQGAGGCSVSSFSSRNNKRPRFDLPVAGGTIVTVTIANDTAATALEFVPTWIID